MADTAIAKAFTSADILKTLSDALKAAEGPRFEDIEVQRSGNKIILPKSMTYEKAIEWCQRMIREESEKIAISETVDAYPLDGALAFMKALKRTYGWTHLVPEPATFFSPEKPPSYITIEIGVGETAQVIWGRAMVPSIDGFFQTNMVVKDNRMLFQITGQTLQKHRQAVKALGDLTREIARAESIYKHQAIRIDFPDITEETYNPMTHMPHFIDTRSIREEELVFPEEVQQLVSTTLFTPIRATDACRAAQIPLKRGILLEGPFGTGKTLTANVCAMLCVRHQWTFIYLADVRRLPEALQFAKQYQPAMIFAEDIDRADDEGSRNELMNHILNTIDGVELKHTEIMVVLTTNYVERINQAMLRPGRLDAVIPVRSPDPDAVQRLIRLFARDLLTPGENLERVGEQLAGQIPAVIREVVERSKLAAIGRLHDAGLDMTRLTLTEGDLTIAANGMLAHLALLKERVPDRRSDLEKAAGVLVEGMTGRAPQDTTVVGGTDGGLRRMVDAAVIED